MTSHSAAADRTDPGAGGTDQLQDARTDLLDAQYDLDGITAGTPPRRSIVVCTTPAAGGDLFAAALRRCGAGVPMEYFDLDAVAAPLARRWRVLNLDAYVDALHHHRATGDGLFAVVLHWHQLRALHQRVAGLTQMSAERMSWIVDTIAPAPDFVFVRAAELDRQAVGWHIAQAGADAEYDPRSIIEKVALIEATQRTWFQWFQAAGIQPLEVTLDPRNAVDPPLDHIVDVLRLTAPPPGADTMAAAPEAAAERVLLRRYRTDSASADVLTLTRSGR
jgi:LPS sulfotransferase NodH